MIKHPVNLFEHQLNVKEASLETREKLKEAKEKLRVFCYKQKPAFTASGHVIRR